MGQLDLVLTEARACTVCAPYFDAGPRPIVVASPTARLVIIGQAPGRRVHESGVPWDDPSGVRLRSWLGLDEQQFYDPRLVAIVPMGFCYPGPGSSGDLAPRPECAPLWHDRILSELPEDRPTLILGAYAIERYVADRGPNLTETVRNWRSHLPHQAVMPHPSPRNQRWFRANPWFDAEVVPAIRRRVRETTSRQRSHRCEKNAPRDDSIR
jgi:uracil-DNA glycosylase